jgi:hypothetical protein
LSGLDIGHLNIRMHGLDISNDYYYLKNKQIIKIHIKYLQYPFSSLLFKKKKKLGIARPDNLGQLI